ncbi:hypothetical protein HPB51_003210 [Rhipicephalus microplus]|uniref:Uncharacterized protein n=1 Tax=Rhipicephalus microplus TaxID=6941 RepID=A0A9J6EK90_RHIMP|nr:hypothetical protein HPB51_003210 [Rhipicephalus microplus]
MAGVPPRPEQTTLQIVVQGVQKEVKALHNPDGSFMTDANGYVYEASDGKRVTLRFMAGNRENDPPPAQPPTPSPACDGDVDSDGALAAFPAAAASAEDVEELWSARKTRFFIAKYSEMKDLVGKTRALRTSITEAPQDAAVPVECNTASKVRSSTTPKRKRQSRSQVTPLLEALEKCKLRELSKRRQQ